MATAPLLQLLITHEMIKRGALANEIRRPARVTQGVCLYNWHCFLDLRINLSGSGLLKGGAYLPVDYELEDGMMSVVPKCCFKQSCEAVHVLLVKWLSVC